MYTIYSTTKGKRVCLYDGFVSDSRIKLIDPELELSANSPGSLTFTIPPNHVAYNDYDIVEYDVMRAGNNDNTNDINGTKCIFRGYVVNEDDIYSIKNPEIGDVYVLPVMPPSEELVGVDGNWAVASGKNWKDLYSTYVTPKLSGQRIVGYVPATSTFNSANWYRKVDDDSYMVFGLSKIVNGKVEIDYDLLDSPTAPDDWDNNYYISYYYKPEGTEIITSIPIGSGPPEYEPNKYYIRQWVHVDTNLPVYKEKLTRLNLVERMVSIITVYRLETYRDGKNFGRRYDKEIWSGRVIGEEVDFNGCRKITCEGAFGYLNDTLQPQRVWDANTKLYTFINDVLNYHNSKASEEHKFRRGVIQDVINKSATSINEGNSPILGEWSTDYGTTMETLAALVDKYGGYFRVDPPGSDGYHLLSYIVAPEENQSDAAKEALVAKNHYIELGKNLLDFTKRWDLSELVTSIIPAGGRKNDVEYHAGDEVMDGHAIFKNKVLDQRSAYEYYSVNSQPDDWSSTYFEYYTVSDTSQTGFKKISKSRKGKVPDFAKLVRDGGVYSRSTVQGSRIVVCDGGSSYQIIKKTVTAGNNYYLSTTIDQGHYAWAWYDQNDAILDANNASKATSGVVYKDKKVEAPTGAKYIRICGYSGEAISLKAEKSDAESDFDSRWRITDYNNTTEENTGWHAKGSAYISNPSLVEKYGIIERQITFDNITRKSSEETDAQVVSRLYDEAKKYLQSTQFDKMSMDVEATDLRILGVAYEGLQLYDAVYVKSEPHGVDRIFPITEMTIPIAHPEEQRITLGYESDSTISGVTVSTSSGIRSEVKSIPSQTSTLKEARKEATQTVFGFEGGAVYFEDNSKVLTDKVPDGKIQAICIVDNANSPTMMWRFSLGGLGFRTKNQQTGEWNDVNLALTNDGKIVADMITTGKLNAERVNGGTLTLGGAFGTGTTERLASHMEIKESQNNIDSLVASAGVDGYKSYGNWTNNKATYTRIDDGFLTAGEATRSQTGAITEYEYGQVKPYAPNVDGTRTGVLIKAAPAGSEYRGYIFLDGKFVGIKDGDTWKYGASGWFSTGNGHVIRVVNGIITSIGGD